MNPAPVSFRPATVADVGAVCRLLMELKLPTAGVQEWWGGFTVAESEERLVGVAGVETYADGALLRSVAVQPSMRGGGLARTLVGKALDTARDAGAKDVYLLTTTAERYFPRLGFVAVPRDTIPKSVQASIEFRGACPDTATAMHLALRDS